jgi:hypothetical protein
MKVKGPIVTLAAGLVFAGTLFGLSVAAKNQRTTDEAAANAVANATATKASSPPAAAPSATPSVAASTAPPAGAPQLAFAGKVEGGAAALAIAVRDGKVIAYLCNGKNLESWMKGTAANGQLSLTGSGSALNGSYADGWATGSVSAAGKQYSFRIKAAQAPSGLYRLATRVGNSQVVGGWIVDGPQTTGILVSDGTPMAAPPIDPATGNVTINGTSVTAAQADPTG